MIWNLLTSVYLNDPARSYVLVSLIAKKGSSYLQPGARMLVRDDGRRWGNISAGCLEDRVASQALECLRSGQHQVLSIDTRPYYGCFGEISLLLEVLSEEAKTVFQGIEAARIQRQSISILTESEPLGEGSLTREYLGQGEGLIETIMPEHRVVIFGDWPDGRALANQSRLMGWEVQIIDASAPHVDVGAIVEGLSADSQTAAVVMTHRLSHDVVCLEAILKKEFGYVGVIGSRKRRQTLEESILSLEDFSAVEALAQVHCPAGLDIGGDGPEAIALSVLAEIQATFTQRSGTPLRLREAAIHTAQ